jgi:arylsulfatase A-like enzyme
MRWKTKMIRGLCPFLLAVLGAGAAAASGRADEAARRPNIVVIVTDDQRFDMLGCTGHPVVKTPNIDRLATEGALFRRFFVVCPLCSPSRASYLTGQYPHRHGVINNDRLGQETISHTLMTSPRRLREAGYETAFIGKWHMGEDDSRRPGFDRWVSFKGQGAYLQGVVADDDTRRQLDEHMTDYLNRQAVEWVKKPRTKPFYLVVAHKAVHAPYLPAPRHEKLYADYNFVRPKVAAGDLAGKPAMTRRLGPHPKFYEIEGVAPEPAEPRRGRGTDAASVVRDQLRCLAGVDEGVGQLLDALASAGQLDRTAVFYTSDNGYLMGEHGRIDDKRWAYEESVRVPLLVRYPPHIKAGSVCDRLTVNVDLAPTVLDLAGVEAVTPMHGRSLVPLFRDPSAAWRSAILTEYFVEKVAPLVPAWQAVRTERWKYIRYTENSAWDELYDLTADPREERNLVRDPAGVDTLPQLRKELERLLTESR